MRPEQWSRLLAVRPLLLGALALAGCVAGDTGPDAIRPDEDTCAFCRMQVSQPQFAAQVLSPDGEHLKYDDIGCFRNALRANPKLAGAPAWVMDFSTRQWLRAADATYLLDGKEPTPMGWHILAFSTSELARRHGQRTATFQEMLAGGH